MRYIGIDYGSKKVGVALSDENGTMGFPHGIFDTAPPLLATMLMLIKKESVGAIVMGDSRDFSGNDNPIAEAARAFGTTLSGQAGIPIYFEDERLTTREAARQFESNEKSRTEKPKQLLDASAAALILTSFLSKPNHG